MNVLLAVDDDQPSLHAARAAAEWLPAEAEVVVLHVGSSVGRLAAERYAGAGLHPYPMVPVAALPSDEELLDQAREVAQRAAEIVDGKARVEQGDTVGTILEVAAQIEADLIVVGTGDRSWLNRLFEPSVGTEVASSAPCSVLVVRPSDDGDG